MIYQKYGKLVYIVGDFVKLPKYCAPNQDAFFYNFACPVNLYFGVKPFGAEKMTPRPKLVWQKIPLRGKYFAQSKNLFKNCQTQI